MTQTTRTTCHHCSAATVPGADFCGECGTALTAGAGAAGPRPARPARGLAVPRWTGGRDLTRYMCAAVFLDRQYATSLIRDVAAEPHLGVAPSPGCDVPVVLRYAYEANARRHARDLVLAVEFLMLFAGLLFGSGLTILLMFLLAWLTTLVFACTTHYGERLQRLRPDRFDPARAPSAPNSSVERRLHRIDEYAHGNLTVYSGFSPFTGYGRELDSWSLTFDVTTSGREGATPGSSTSRTCTRTSPDGSANCRCPAWNWRSGSSWRGPRCWATPASSPIRWTVPWPGSTPVCWTR